MPPRPIDSFTGEHRFLSNFHPTTFEWMDLTWQTAEHAYQWAKCIDSNGVLVHEVEAHQIIVASRPGKAKRIGKAEKLNTPEWRARRLAVMESILRAKFANPVLRKRLIDTAPAELIEGNFHGDKFWGVYNGVGSNHLGALLMKLRAEFIQGSIFD